MKGGIRRIVNLDIMFFNGFTYFEILAAALPIVVSFLFSGAGTCTNLGPFSLAHSFISKARLSLRRRFRPHSGYGWLLFSVSGKLPGFEFCGIESYRTQLFMEYQDDIALCDAHPNIPESLGGASIHSSRLGAFGFKDSYITQQ